MNFYYLSIFQIVTGGAIDVPVFIANNLPRKSTDNLVTAVAAKDELGRAKRFIPASRSLMHRELNELSVHSRILQLRRADQLERKRHLRFPRRNKRMRIPRIQRK